MSKNKLFVLMAAIVAIVISVGFYNLGDNRNPATQVVGKISEPVYSSGMDLVGSWTTGANMPVYAYHGGSFSFNRNDTGWVFIVGGDLTGAGVITTQNYRYNVNTNTWTLMAPYPTAPGIWYTSGAKVGTNGYIVAGLTGGALANVTAQTNKYDINANTWTIMAPMPAPRGQNKCVGYQDSLLYSAGGFDATGTYQPDVYLYNQTANSWRAATPLPAGRGGGAFAISGDTLVYVNGCTGAFSSTTVLTTYVGVISQSNRATITWTTKANYPGTSRFRPDAMSWGCRGIIYSGGASAPAYTPTVSECYVYSPGADLWTVQPPMITGRGAHMTGSVSQPNGRWKFINVCGFNGANVLTTDIFTDSLCASAPGGITQVVCRNGINVAVPDNSPNGARDTIRVIGSGGCSLTDVNVTIQLFNHTFDGDMAFTLNHNATTVALITNRGGSGDNFVNTVLNDSAATSISAGTAPFTGPFRPEQPLSGFNGPAPTGNWVLFMVDGAAADLGFLHDWCITFQFTCPTGGIQTITVPNHYRLSQNYPNPFNPTTTISYGMPKPGLTKLVVYDILGKEVRTLVNEFKDAGLYDVSFDASSLASGIYFYTLTSGDFSMTKKMLLVK